MTVIKTVATPAPTSNLNASCETLVAILPAPESSLQEDDDGGDSDYLAVSGNEKDITPIPSLADLGLACPKAFEVAKPDTKED